MSNIIIAKSLSDAPQWAYGDQVQKDSSNRPRVNPALRLPAINQWNMPEGIFYYGKDRTVEQPFQVDIDIAPKHDRLTGITHLSVLGIHLMCPRCLQPLYIRTADSPSGLGRPSHQIEVHWHDRKVSEDGFWRPTFSVGGPVKCENQWKTSKRATPDTTGFCNWRGGIWRGRCLDHWR